MALNLGEMQATIRDAFKEFGYTPTPEEINSLIPSAKYSREQGSSAVAQYVLAKKSFMEQRANDPLQKVLDSYKTFYAAQQARAQGLESEAKELYGQLTQKLSSAPKLFGEFTPEQINQYLAPLKQTFNESGAAVETAAARRGLGGSSTELNALSENERKFKENTLAQGLQVGMTQQQLQAAAIQQEIMRRTGLLQGAIGAQENALAGQAGVGSQLSKQEFDATNTMIGLPAYLQGQSAQEHALAMADKGPSLWDQIDRGISTASNFKNLFSLGGGDGGKKGGSPRSGMPNFGPDTASGSSVGADSFIMAA